MKNIFLLIILFITILACKKEKSKVEKVQTAFYYWKTSDWYMKNEEKEILKKTKTQKLYVKFFEVAYNEFEGNIPVSKNNLRVNDIQNYDIIPSVYIRNDVFKKSKKEELKKLADDINYLIEKKIKDKFDKYFKIKEIQIDCDWTLSTKENYFYFLEELDKVVSEKKEISCTLRLYPYKYPEKMGVPPVNKVMLMCYNLISPLKSKEKNSILNIEELKKYLVKKEKYPKHLDVALPLYSWMQIFQNNQFTKIIYKDFDKVKAVLKPIKPLWFEVTKDTLAGDVYLRVGDKVKYDEISVNTIKEAITVIKEKVSLDEEITLSFFHLDNEQLKYFKNEEITNLYHLITK